MAELTDVLHEFVARYRARIVAKAAILGALSLGVLAVLGWRLRLAHLHPGWSAWLPMTLACGLVASLSWWVRRHWLSHHSAAAHLDQALGLQQRLVTAEEFAHTPQPPALYSLLVEDAARRCSPQQTRFPRPLDRNAGTLIVVLLLLLLWPGAGSKPFRLPLRPTKTPPEPHAPPEVPRPPDRQQEEQRQQQGSSSPQTGSSAGQGGESQSSAGHESATNPSQPNAGADQSTQPHDGSQGGANTQASRSGNAPQGQTGQQGSNTTNSQAGQAQSGAQQQERGGREAGGQQKQATSQQANGRSGGLDQAKGQSSSRSGQQAKGQGEQPAGSGQQQTAQGTQRSSSQGRQSGRSSSGQPDRSSTAAQQQAAQRGGGESAGNDEALKAEIQQLLKEVSGEMKDLQAQLASKANQTPQAGTDSDPNLYESPMTLDRTSGEALPIQLNTDSAQIKGQRPGSGVGKPSGEVDSAAPKIRAEGAQLSDTPREETPTAHQPVPPEYRSIFDQLRRESAQPSETGQ